MEVKLEPQNKENGLIFHLVSFGANVKTKSGTSERTAWATLQAPETGPIQVAVGPGNYADDIVLPEELLVAMRDFVKLVEESTRIEMES